MSVQKAFEKAVNRLPEAPVVVEIGAHVGDGVRYILSRRPKAIIYAVEPSVRAYKKLLNTPAHCSCVAISGLDEAGKMVANKNHRQVKFVKATKPSTFAIKMSEYLSRNRIEHIDLLRFDCYGSEYAIMRGDVGFLKTTDSVCITMHKAQSCPKTTQIKLERAHIKATLSLFGFQCVASYGSGIHKHLFQLWVKK